MACKREKAACQQGKVACQQGEKYPLALTSWGARPYMLERPAESDFLFLGKPPQNNFSCENNYYPHAARKRGMPVTASPFPFV